jgi:hypothetical protein
MAQAVTRRPVTAETPVRAQVSQYGLCGGQGSNRTGLSPSSAVFYCQHHSTVALNSHISSGGQTIGPLVAAVQRHRLTSST